MNLYMQKKIVYFACLLQKDAYYLVRRFLLLIVLFGLSKNGTAQLDQQFSQLFNNQAFINPGAAGSDTSGLYNVLALNRSQTSNFEGAPNTTMINVNGPLKLGNIDGGVNLSLYNDKLGKITSPGFDLGYAYRLSMDKGSLGIGFTAGMFFSTLDAGGWRTPDGSSDDNAIPTEKGSKKSFNFGLGAFYQNKNWHLGVSGVNLNRPAFVVGDNSSKLRRVFHLYGGYSFLLPNNPYFEVSTNVHMFTDVSIRSMILGLLTYKKKYWGGINYRMNSSVGLVVGLNLFSELKVGYNYEYNTSTLSRFSGGNHEIMLSYRFAAFLDKGKQKYKSVRYL